MGGSKGHMTRTLGKQGGQMPAFFASTTPTSSQPMIEKSSPNMADEAGSANPEDEQLSRADLEALGDDLKQHLST